MLFCLAICDHAICGVPPVFIRTHANSFASLLLLNTEQDRQRFTIYYLPTQHHYTDKCQCLYDKSTITLTAKSMGVPERQHCSAMEGLGIHGNTNTQKVHNWQDRGLVLITSAREVPCLINDMWTGMTRDMTVYPVFRRLLPAIYSYLLTCEPPLLC